MSDFLKKMSIFWKKCEFLCTTIFQLGSVYVPQNGHILGNSLTNSIVTRPKVQKKCNFLQLLCTSIWAHIAAHSALMCAIFEGILKQSIIKWVDFQKNVNFCAHRAGPYVPHMGLCFGQKCWKTPVFSDFSEKMSIFWKKCQFFAQYISSTKIWRFWKKFNF